MASALHRWSLLSLLYAHKRAHTRVLTSTAPGIRCSTSSVSLGTLTSSTATSAFSTMLSLAPSHLRRGHISTFSRPTRSMPCGDSLTTSGRCVPMRVWSARVEWGGGGRCVPGQCGVLGWSGWGVHMRMLRVVLSVFPSLSPHSTPPTHQPPPQRTTTTATTHHPYAHVHYVGNHQHTRIWPRLADGRVRLYRVWC